MKTIGNIPSYKEYTTIMIYLFLNYDEVVPFVRHFEEELLKTYRNMSDEEVQRKTGF